MTAGRLIAVVGPSGVGKDSVMAALAATGDGFALVRRVITRPSEAGGEDFEGVSAEEFASRADNGDFALHWQAHGLSYGIPSSVDADLASGRTMLVNLSRTVLDTANQRFPGLITLALSARREVLAARLAARGRESAAAIEARLNRQTRPLNPSLTVLHIDNSGALADTVETVRRALQRESA